MILGGRDGDALAKLAEQCKMEYRVFGLDDREDVRRALGRVDVLLNAAGPFAWTAERLVKDALAVDCHYVDINGEVDVYKRLDDLDHYARQRQRAIVCSAGHTAAASDLLLNAALDQFGHGVDLDGGPELGAVRIAMSRVPSLSRGSAETVWRSLREQVTIVRTLETQDPQDSSRGARLWHEPVGKLERTFDFRDHGRPDARPSSDRRIASAANLVDTLTARLTVARKRFSVKRIESYVEAGAAARIAYQLGTFLAPVAAIPWVHTLARQQIDFLPPGPTKQELEETPQIVLLEIEDPFQSRLIDWRWETPNAYQFTAQVVVEIAKRLAEAQDPPPGWLTPGAIFPPSKGELTAKEGALRDCRLDDRLVTF